MTLEGPSVFSRIPDDAWGLILLVSAALAALGTWADLTGPAGRAVRRILGDLVGLGRLPVPIVLGTIGMALVMGHGHPDAGADPTDDTRTRGRRMAGRIGLGSFLSLTAVAGLLHVGQGLGTAGSEATPERLRSAGGLVGGISGGLLRTGVSGFGATLVLLVVLLGGVLVLTGTPVGLAWRSLAHGSSSVGKTVVGGYRAARARAKAGREAPTGPRPFDQDLADDFRGDPAPVAHKPRSPRAPKLNETEPPIDLANAIALVPIGDRPAVKIALPVEPTVGEQLTIDLGPGAEGTPWQLPRLDLFVRGEAEKVDTSLIEARGRTLEDALAQHGVATRLVGMTVGPQVTRYELELGTGVKVARVTTLQKDIAYAMAAPDIRLQAPIPGRSAIGVEVPNVKRQMVLVGDLLCSSDAHAETHPLTVAIGRDIAGRVVLANLAAFPHVLIAGATGAGKSSAINSLLSSLLARSTPEQVRLIMIDPKRVELGQYNGIPHLLTPVVTNAKKAANALAWAVTEMERRYDLLSEAGFRDITGYNKAHDKGELVDHVGIEEARLLGNDPPPPRYNRLPFIVVVIDELADLMMVAARDVEESICRLAQMARAVGIHLVIATQRPSVDVITGLIKANVPSRIAFSVSTAIDSKVVLDQMGAEKLVGKGDMLMLEAASNIARRVQGAWVSEEEVRAIVGHWKKQATIHSYDAKVAEAEILGAGGAGDDPSGLSGLSAALPGGDVDEDDEAALNAAMELVVRSQLGSTSMLQRKLRVGFARAGRLMDLLEQKGVVGPSEGSKARAVLMTPDEFEALLRRTRAG